MKLFQKKYRKDLLLLIGAVLLCFLAVSSDGFSDLANKKFWWSFWSVVHVLSILACVGGWAYLVSKDRPTWPDKK